MKKEDFEFIKLDEEYKDYWFKVKDGTISEAILTEQYMEQSMVCISEVVYSVRDDVLGVKQLFPFNFYVLPVQNEELKKIIISLIDDIKKKEMK
jgi:hypothetical protein